MISQICWARVSMVSRNAIRLSHTSSNFRDSARKLRASSIASSALFSMKRPLQEEQRPQQSCRGQPFRQQQGWHWLPPSLRPAMAFPSTRWQGIPLKFFMLRSPFPNEEVFFRFRQCHQFRYINAQSIGNIHER